MNDLYGLRKKILIPSIALFVLQIILVFTFGWIKVLETFMTMPIYMILPIIIMSCITSASIILELTGTGLPVQEWSNKKYFLVFFLIAISLCVIQILGLVHCR